MPYALYPETHLRPESLAALWFHPRTAETLELDLEGLETLLGLLRGEKLKGWRAWHFRNYLLARAYLRRVPNLEPRDIQRVANCLQTAQNLETPLRARSAPEVLHISLTDACQQSCSGCFFSNQVPGQPNRYLAPERYRAVIEQAASVQVFQIALGGGEPLMHPRLVDFVAFATARGLVVNLTSNAGLLTPELAQSLRAAGLGQLQLSLNGSVSEIHSQTRPGFEQVQKAIEICRREALRWGLNVLITRQNLNDLDAILRFAQQWGAYSVNILRPKPSPQDPEWLSQNVPSATDNRTLTRILKRWQHQARFILQTDSSLAFLRSGSVRQLVRSGVSGCSAGRRMLSIQVDGRVSPCSFVPLYDKMEQGDFMAVWQASQHLDRFRHLEEELSGLCGQCELKSVCRGCRAIVWHEQGNFEGADLQCPKHRSMSSWHN